MTKKKIKESYGVAFLEAIQRKQHTLHCAEKKPGSAKYRLQKPNIGFWRQDTNIIELLSQPIAVFFFVVADD